MAVLTQRPGVSHELASALRREFSGEVADDAYSRHLFAADAGMYAVEPQAVAFPRTAADVAAAMAVCARLEVPIVARGAATSLAGQTAGGRGLVLDTSRHLCAIADLDVERRSVRVGPGVVQEDLNRFVKRHGLVFGPDTSTSNRATLGGMIGNNSSGSASIVHGQTIDHVLELDVVLADGSPARLAAGDTVSKHVSRETGLLAAIRGGLPDILERNARAIAEDYPKHWRQSGGYRLDRLAASLAAGPRGRGLDLARFIVGSEGTLCVVTDATVGLVETPKARQFAVGHFDSVAAAIAATDDALALEASAIELIDKKILDLSRSKLVYRELASTLQGDPEALLFVTFDAPDHDAVSAQLDRLEAAWSEHGHGYSVLRAETQAQQDALTTVRKAGLGLLMAASEGARRPLAFVEDTAVDPARLNDYVAEFKEILDRHGLDAGFYGHCSVGCLHVRPYVDLTDPREEATMRAVAEEIVDLVERHDGVNSSEHGDGRARSEFNRRIFGAELYGAMVEVKRLFDPQGILNPGMIVDAPSMTADLRDPSLPPAPKLETHFSFAATGGMRGAADRCMRIGACRKTGTGVMCPSYMATREEEHATRGRANALVKALSEPEPARALGDERLHEILDLCLECKACKSECPLSVDMATMKSEFLSHYQAIHGVPLRSRLFASIRRLNRVGSALAPLSNLPLPRGLMERVTGIAARRPLPRFARQSLVGWWSRRGDARAGTADRAAGTPRGELVFLADSFTTYTEPGIGRAAIELLEAAGWDVQLEHRGCCGRAAISKGLLDQAKAQAADLAARLAPYAQRGVPIVGCEPSCLLTLTEEHPDLLPEDPHVRAVAKVARLADELILEALQDGSLRLDPASAPANRRYLFHGHCHQKALVGTAATVGLLQAIPGAEVVELDAGCCGMAGSFGFEAEHYDLSLKIGESRLFPAVRTEGPATLIAATGVSCRQQIPHGTGRVARHPVQYVRDALLAEHD